MVSIQQSEHFTENTLFKVYDVLRAVGLTEDKARGGHQRDAEPRHLVPGARAARGITTGIAPAACT